MELTSRVNGNVKILALSGSFDTFSSGMARKWMEEAVKTPPAYLVINLANVEFLDSTALSTLVQGMKRARERRGDMRLCGLQQPVRMIFELTRLDRVFEIFTTEEGAVQAFQG
jgi:anti-sigma B factor antagonist